MTKENDEYFCIIVTFYLKSCIFVPSKNESDEYSIKQYPPGVQ